MTSRANADFVALLRELPRHIQITARFRYEQFRANPAHPSLRFKPVRPGLWSARVTQNYRVLGRRRDDLIVWFWIGTHAEYDKIIASFK